jgi:hypothetical protein
VQDTKEERKAAEVRKLGIYHELMGNDDGIVHLLHTPAAAKNMEDNRREKKEVRKERNRHNQMGASLGASGLLVLCLLLL